MEGRSYNAVVVQGRVYQLQFPNRTWGWGVEKVELSTPAHEPLAPSPAIAGTPVTHSNPTEGHQMSQEPVRLPANEYFVWDHSPAVVSVQDDDGDAVQVNHVYVGDETQVWLTAVGVDGQGVQVSLDADTLRQLGERLLDEAEGMS